MPIRFLPLPLPRFDESLLSYLGQSFEGIRKAFGSVDTEIKPPLFYNGSVANGTMLSFQNILSETNIGVAPFPLTMVVRASGDMGANGAPQTTTLRITDGSTVNITQGAVLNGAGITVKNFNGNDGKPFYIVGRRTYLTNEIMGFKFQYMVDTSNIYVGVHAEVDFYPR